MTGKIYNIPPQPPVEENTRRIEAGALTFGVEYRDLDPESLAATYAGNAAHLAELEAESPPGGFTDEGVSVHVFATDEGHEYLRFDLFDDAPHYHYIHKTGPDEPAVNNVVDYDAVAMGDVLPWAMERLRTRLPDMLRQAGGGHLVDRIDDAVVRRAIDEVEELARAARDAHRASVAAR